VPRNLRAARDLFNDSDVARSAFGDDDVEHYVHAADTQFAAIEEALTDWELRRGFERF
jgi:glutamine synthetase